MYFLEWIQDDQPAEMNNRINKARSAELTPLEIDSNSSCARFSGSNGLYETTIDSCTCVDFARRKLPCKHMYRLAAELKIIDIGSFSSDVSKVKRKITPQEREAALAKCIELVSSYPIETQRAVHYVLGARYGKMSFVCENIDPLVLPMKDGIIKTVSEPERIIEHFTQKRTVDGLLALNFEFPSEIKKTKKARYEWCLQNASLVCGYVYPECAAVTTDGLLEVCALKMYTYMNRLFEDDFIFE